MRGGADFGLSGLIASTEPRLGILSRKTLHCWQWCGGWSPERFLIYRQLYPVSNVDELIALLIHLQNEIRA